MKPILLCFEDVIHFRPSPECAKYGESSEEDIPRGEEWAESKWARSGFHIKLSEEYRHDIRYGNVYGEIPVPT